MYWKLCLQLTDSGWHIREDTCTAVGVNLLFKIYYDLHINLGLVFIHFIVAEWCQQETFG